MKRILIVALLCCLFVTSRSIADVSDEDFEQLRAQLTQMSARLDRLAAENAELRSAQIQYQNENEKQLASLIVGVGANPEVGGAIEPAAAEQQWSDRVKLDGDFRYRYELIEVEGSSERRRNRIRARTNITAKVVDNIEVGFGLATGGDDPVSTNQTLGGGGSSKQVALNLAYVDWEALDGLHLYAGKFKNPLKRVGGQPLLWDGDWTPEGIALKYQHNVFFVNAFGEFLESDSKDNNDSFAWGAQFGAVGSVGAMTVTGGVAYYAIEAKGKSTSFGDQSDSDDFYGNTAVEASGFACGTNVGTRCEYLYDYLLTEVFAEASFEFGVMPVKLFADYVNNSDAPDDNTGWTLGGKIGHTKGREQLALTYYYTDKGADSMLGLVTDSDFGGGGTNNKGHWFQINYGVSKSWTVGAQYFFNDIDLNTNAKRDFDRFMIDMQWKWK
ncbi:MAG: hypothetical protein ACI9B8_003296 [Sulfitobacter sp.]|jgi:hypothetical protein